MATRSFTDMYKLDRKQLVKLHDIINKQPKVEVKEIIGHKDIKGKAIAKMLCLEK